MISSSPCIQRSVSVSSASPPLMVTAVAAASAYRDALTLAQQIGDVPAEIEDRTFWPEFRERVRAVRPDA